MNKRLVVIGIAAALATTVQAGDWNMTQTTNPNGDVTYTQTGATSSHQSLNEVNVNAGDTVSSDTQTVNVSHPLGIVQGAGTNSSYQTVNALYANSVTTAVQTLNANGNALILNQQSVANNKQVVNNAQDVTNNSSIGTLNQVLSAPAAVTLTQDAVTGNLNDQAVNRASFGGNIGTVTQDVNVSAAPASATFNQSPNTNTNTQAANMIWSGGTTGTSNQTLTTGNSALSMTQNAGGNDNTQSGNFLDNEGAITTANQTVTTGDRKSVV